jgi:predicted RND superfamily exporter protein
MNNLFLYVIKKKIYLFLILLFSLISIFFISLKIDGSTDKFLIQNDPEKAIYNETIKVFGSDNSVVITIGDKDLFTYEKLSKIKDIISKLQKLEGVIDVDSIFNQKNIVNKKDGLHNDVFIDKYSIPKDKKTLLEIKKDALNNPLVKKIFISENGNYLFLSLRLKDDRSSEYSIYITNSIQNILNQYKNSFTKLNQFGFVYINKNVTTNIIKDLTFTIPIAILVIIFILYFNLKNFKLTLIPIITATLSIIITLGIMGLLGIKLTILTSLSPVLIILIGSTEDSHIISEYIREIQENKNRDKDKIMTILNNHIVLAIIITAITTVIGFGSIYLNNIIMLKEFSLITTIGLIINFIVTIVVVPNYLYYLDINKIESAKKKAFDYKFILDLTEKFFYKGKNYIIALFIITTVLSIYYLPKIIIDNNTLSYFQKDSEVRKQAKFMENHLYGAQTFYIRLKTDKKGAFKNYKYVHAMEKIKHYILNDSQFKFAASLADYISVVNKAMHNDNEKFYKTPKNKFLIEQYLLFFHRKDLKHYVSSDYSSANMVVWHNLFSSNKFNAEKAKLRNFIKNNIDPSIKIDIVGQDILISKASTTIAKGEIYSIWVTLITAFILITIVFKNAKAGIVIIIANGLPVLLVFIIVGILNIQLNMVTAMVAAISFGIVVDDTIHILLHYKHNYKKSKEVDKSIINAVRKEGRAVILTSTYLSIGFLILLTSTFVPVQDYAFLSILVMIFALLSDLFVTPNLIKFVNQKEEK